MIRNVSETNRLENGGEIMNPILEFIKNDGKNVDEKVAYNLIQIVFENANGEYVYVDYELYDFIKEYIGNFGITNIYGHLNGLNYWYESGLVFDNYQEMLRAINSLEDELNSLLQNYSSEFNILKDGMKRLKVYLFNSHYYD